MDLGPPGNQLHGNSSDAANKQLLKEQSVTLERTREKG